MACKVVDLGKFANHTVDSDLAFACPHSTHDESNTINRTEVRLRIRAIPIGLDPDDADQPIIMQVLSLMFSSIKGVGDCSTTSVNSIILKGRKMQMHREDGCTHAPNLVCMRN